MAVRVSLLVCWLGSVSVGPSNLLVQSKIFDYESDYHDIWAIGSEFDPWLWYKKHSKNQWLDFHRIKCGPKRISHYVFGDFVNFTRPNFLFVLPLVQYG